MQYKFVDNFIKKLRERDNQARLSSVYSNAALRTPKDQSRVDPYSVEFGRNQRTSQSAIGGESRVGLVSASHDKKSQYSTDRRNGGSEHENNILTQLKDELL